MKARLATLACVGLLQVACGKKSDPTGAPSPTDTAQAKPESSASAPKSTSAATPPPAKSAAVFKGTIEGVVRLADGATLPKLVNMKDGSPYSMTEPPKPCSPLDDADLTPVAMSANRELRDIHLALTGMTDYPTPTPKTHDLYLSDCRLTPRLVGAAVGDSLRITNRSTLPLLPVFSGESFMQAVMPESSRELKVQKTGANRVACTFGSFCGRTDVLVTAHALFAVSDAKGHFVIENVPLDQEITLHAWHPLFQDSTATVRLSAAEPKRVVELTLTPVPSQTPPPGPVDKQPSSTKPAADKKKRTAANADAAKPPSAP